VEDGGKLVLDDGHLPLQFHKLGKYLLGDAFRLLLLYALVDSPEDVGVFGTRQQVLRVQRLVPQFSVFIWLNSAMDSR